MVVRVLGTREYSEVWGLQKKLVKERLSGKIPDTLLLLEHFPVYTCGASSRAAVPGRLPHPYHVVERGGDYTYHGPGQLVGYPIVRLGEKGLNPVSYLRALETILIDAVRPLGIEAETLKGFTGVWSRGRKIASIGVAVRRDVAYHGFALNVACDLTPFGAIYPCNLEPGSVSSLKKLLGRNVDMKDVIRRVRESFLTFFEPRAHSRITHLSITGDSNECKIDPSQIGLWRI